MANLYFLCSLLMATLFLISASLQLNDKECYYWIPLYAGAAYTNVINVTGSVTMWSGVYYVGNMSLILSQFMLSNVVAEHLSGASVGFLSIDMRERIVREKFGATLVCICMIFQISVAASFERDPAKKATMAVAPATKYGMAALVGIGYGLSAVFFICHLKEMKL